MCRNDGYQASGLLGKRELDKWDAEQTQKQQCLSGVARSMKPMYVQPASWKYLEVGCWFTMVYWVIVFEPVDIRGPKCTVWRLIMFFFLAYGMKGTVIVL